jgi:DNA-directed RNA polymerase specialized sigma24 family protein
MAAQPGGMRQGTELGHGPDEHALLSALAAVSAALAGVEVALIDAGEPVPLHLRRERDRLQAARSDAFRAWSAREARRLREVLRSQTKGSGALDPDDLLQQVFLRVTLRASAYRGSTAGQAKAWAAAIACNLVLDARRRHKRKEGLWDALEYDPKAEGPASIDRLSDNAPGADARIDWEVRELHWPAAVDHCEAHAFALVQTRSPADLYAMGQAANIGTLTSVPKHIRAYRLLRLLHHSPAEAADDLGVARGSVHKLSARGREGLKLGQARALHPTAPEPDPPSREVGSVVPLLHF